MLIEQNIYIVWSVQRIVEKLNFRLRWGVLNTVALPELIIKWNLLRALEKDFTFNWTLIKNIPAVRGCRNYVYPCANRVANCTDSCFIVGTSRSVTSNITFNWDLGLARSSLIMPWDVELNLVTVTTPVTFLWDISS